MLLENAPHRIPTAFQTAPRDRRKTEAHKQLANHEREGDGSEDHRTTFDRDIRTAFLEGRHREGREGNGGYGAEQTSKTLGPKHVPQDREGGYNQAARDEPHDIIHFLRPFLTASL